MGFVMKPLPLAALTKPRRKEDGITTNSEDDEERNIKDSTIYS